MLIKELFPRGHQRYLLLPVLGCELDGFSTFLDKLGYPKPVIRVRIQAVFAIDHQMQKIGCRNMLDITRAILLACAPPPGKSQENIAASATVKLLERYFDNQGVFLSQETPDPIQMKILKYRSYLQSVRDLAPSTVSSYLLTAEQFLSFLTKRDFFLIW